MLTLLGFNFLQLQGSSSDSEADAKVVKRTVPSFLTIGVEASSAEIMREIEASNLEEKALKKAQQLIHSKALRSRQQLEQELNNHLRLLSNPLTNMQETKIAVLKSIERAKEEIAIADLETMKVKRFQPDKTHFMMCFEIEKVLDPQPCWRPRQLDEHQSDFSSTCYQCMPFDYFCYPSTPSNKTISWSVAFMKQTIERRLKRVQGISQTWEQEARHKKILTGDNKLKVFISKKHELNKVAEQIKTSQSLSQSIDR